MIFSNIRMWYPDSMFCQWHRFSWSWHRSESKMTCLQFLCHLNHSRNTYSQVLRYQRKQSLKDGHTNTLVPSFWMGIYNLVIYGFGYQTAGIIYRSTTFYSNTLCSLLLTVKAIDNIIFSIATNHISQHTGSIYAMKLE